MEIEKDKINYRRANINDIEFLVDYRVRFLNELYNHKWDGCVANASKVWGT